MQLRYFHLENAGEKRIRVKYALRKSGGRDLSLKPKKNAPSHPERNYPV